MKFLLLRKNYGKGFILNKEFFLSLKKKKEKMFGYFFLKLLVCHTFEKKNLSLALFRFSFCENFFLFSSFIKRNSQILKKLYEFFKISHFCELQESLFFLIMFFKNLIYEMELILKILKKGIFEGWVSFSSFFFYLTPFFALFKTISLILKKKNMKNFFSEINNQGEVGFVGKFVKEASWFLWLGNFYLSWLNFNPFLIKEKEKKHIKNSFYFFPYYVFFKLNPYSKKFKFSPKYFKLSETLAKSLPGGKKMLFSKKKGKARIFLSFKREKFVARFFPRFFFCLSQLIFTIIKKKKVKKKSIQNFSRFLFYFWGQLFFDLGNLFIKVKPLLPFTENESEKNQKNFFGFFSFKIFNHPEIVYKISRISDSKIQKKKTFLPDKNLVLNFIYFFGFLRWPFSVLITHNSIKKYQIFLKFLFRFKKEETFFISIWVKKMTDRTKQRFPNLPFVIALVQQILAFYRTMIYHIVYQVFEKNLGELKTKLPFALGFHHVIFLHEKFILKCLDQSFISSPSFYKIILRIFTTSSLFGFFLTRSSDNLIRFEYSNEVYKKKIKKQNKKAFKSQLSFQIRIFKYNFEKNLFDFFNLDRQNFFSFSSLQDLEKIFTINNYYF